MVETPPNLVVRLYFAAMLGIFAFAPTYIAFWTLVEVLKAPLSTPIDAVFILAVCIPLSYFLLLLAYRSITWKGRSSDGGLLPPLAMLLFAAFFGLVGIAGFVFTLWHREYLKSLLAIAYLAAAIPTARSYWRRLVGT